MKEKLLSVFLMFMIIRTTVYSQNSEYFNEINNIDTDSCLLYAYRGIDVTRLRMPFYVFKYNREINAFVNVTENNKEFIPLNKRQYYPVMLRSNEFYWIQYGEILVALFSGSGGSITVVKQKGLKIFLSTIQGNSIITTNSDSDIHIEKEIFNKWTDEIRGVQNFEELNIKDELETYNFYVLKSDSDSDLFKELKGLKKVLKKNKKKSAFKTIKIRYQF